MTESLTTLRLKMLDWIARGNVSRGVRADRFAVGSFPHATAGAADRAATWLVSHGYARLPADRRHDRPFELTDKGRRALAEEGVELARPTPTPDGAKP